MNLQQTMIKNSKIEEIKLLAEKVKVEFHQKDSLEESFLITQFWTWHPWWFKDADTGNLYLSEEDFQCDHDVARQAIESFKLLDQLMYFKEEYGLDIHQVVEMGVEVFTY